MIEALGSENYINLEVNFGIKNGFKKLLNKNLPFIKWLLEGFIIEITSNCNSKLMKNVLKLI